MPSPNEAIIAAAGSGKTERILDAAVGDASVRALIITYTNENLREIKARLWSKAGGTPPNVTAMTWFEFLLRHGVRPYQSYKTSICRIRSINFVTDNPPYAKREDFERYYLDSADNVYSDAVSDLAVLLNSASGGKVIDRLADIYDRILVDEVQDLAGYDLEFLQLLLASRIHIVMVGDPRQAVYVTNRANKNSQFRGAKIVDWLLARAEEGLCEMETLSTSYRCNQAICDFADSVFPAMPTTQSANLDRREDSGVVFVHREHLDAYRAEYDVQELRWDRRSPLAGQNARNFGQVKGQSFERVLIHPTKGITDFIERGVPLREVTAAKFYVAITRARHSVAVVTEKRSTSTLIPLWCPPVARESWD